MKSSKRLSLRILKRGGIVSKVAETPEQDIAARNPLAASPPSKPAAAAPETSTDVQAFRSAVESMDALARHGFTEIQTVARLALAALQVPETYSHPEVIALALQSIAGTADDINDRVGWHAEQVIEPHDDASTERRFRAFQAAREAYRLT